jgi:hypothetical protein
MTCFSLSLGCAPDFSLTGRPMPEALLFNVAPIYENLKWMLLPDGGFVYPSGQDWELFRNPAWLGKHTLMTVYGRDPEAWRWTLQTLDVIEKMQARNASGAIYHPGEYFFASTQHDILRALANSWLALQCAPAIPTGAIIERLGVRKLDSAQMILRRTPTAIHTVSWGARVMAQCVPLRMDRLVSPHERNGIGHVRLKDAKVPLPLKVVQADVTDQRTGFVARLRVDHGKAVRAELAFRSQPDGSFELGEKLVALTNITTAEIATGLIGILNDPAWIFESGHRSFKADNDQVEAAANSGRQCNWNGVRRLAVDNALEISSEQPLRAAYLAASKAERGRVTDRLYLHYLAEEKTWKTGEVISEYRATIR